LIAQAGRQHVAAQHYLHHVPEESDGQERHIARDARPSELEAAARSARSLLTAHSRRTHWAESCQRG
jgi:hypothetical protein